MIRYCKASIYGQRPKTAFSMPCGNFLPRWGSRCRQDDLRNETRLKQALRASEAMTRGVTLNEEYVRPHSALEIEAMRGWYCFVPNVPH